MKLSEPTTKIALKNVLFTTDFSPISETALLFAENIARRYGSKLTVAHVISPLETRMVPSGGMGCMPAGAGRSGQFANEVSGSATAHAAA